MTFADIALHLDAEEIIFDLELPAGSAVWLAQVEQIVTAPDNLMGML